MKKTVLSAAKGAIEAKSITADLTWPLRSLPGNFLEVVTIRTASDMLERKNLGSNNP